MKRCFYLVKPWIVHMVIFFFFFKLKIADKNVEALSLQALNRASREVESFIIAIENKCFLVYCRFCICNVQIYLSHLDLIFEWRTSFCFKRIRSAQTWAMLI